MIDSTYNSNRYPAVFSWRRYHAPQSLTHFSVLLATCIFIGLVQSESRIAVSQQNSPGDLQVPPQLSGVTPSSASGAANTPSANMPNDLRRALFNTDSTESESPIGSGGNSAADPNTNPIQQPLIRQAPSRLQQADPLAMPLAPPSTNTAGFSDPVQTRPQSSLLAPSFASPSTESNRKVDEISNLQFQQDASQDNVASGELIQKATYAQSRTDGMESGVIRPDAPKSMLGLAGNNSVQPPIDQTYVQSPAAELDPIEEKYGKIWREMLISAEIEGEFLEVYQILQLVPQNAQPEVLSSYWRLAEAIVKWKIQEEGRQWWNEATNQNGSVYATSINESMTKEVALAAAEMEAAQKRFSQLAQRFGLPSPSRPADAPFLGPYNTKINEFQVGMMSEQLSSVATNIDKTWKSINDDVATVEWARQQWASSQNMQSPEKSAATFQLMQRSLLIMAGHVTEYNKDIADYSLNVAGFGKSTEQRVAMLLRQPIIGGVVMDTKNDPLFKSNGTLPDGLTDANLGGSMIAQVSYTDMYGVPISDPNLIATLNDGYDPNLNSFNGDPLQSNMQYGLNRPANFSTQANLAPSNIGYSNISQSNFAQTNGLSSGFPQDSGVPQNSGGFNAQLDPQAQMQSPSFQNPPAFQNPPQFQNPLSRTAGNSVQGLRVPASNVVPSNPGAWKAANDAASGLRR